MMAMTESPRPSVHQSFLRFALIGVVGFLVDAGILTLALSLGADFYTGRVFSFVCAVTATWYMNRIYTFASQDPRRLREWWRFVSVNAVGALINFTIYALLVSMIGLFASYPVAAVGAGSVAGLLWNFIMSHQLVFAK
jgi:putative flippase GtrA